MIDSMRRSPHKDAANFSHDNLDWFHITLYFEWEPIEEIGWVPLI